MSPRFAAVATLLLALCSLPARAQIAAPNMDASDGPFPGSRGTNRDAWSINSGSISGRVAITDGTSAADIRVDLHNTGTGAVIASAVTDLHGGFEFRNLAPGVYEVVAFRGVNEARERVTLTGIAYEVTLHLAPALADANSGATGPTVSIAQMKVPGKAKNEFRKAQERLRKHNTTEARQNLLKALAIYPNYADAHAFLGVVDLEEQKPKDAVAELEKAIQLDPNASLSFIILAAVYNSLGRYDDALRALDSSTRLAPNTWQAYFEMAKAYLGKGDFTASLQQVDKAQSFLHGDEYAPIHLVRAHALLGLKEYPKAVAELEQYLSRQPQGPAASEARQALDQAKAFAAANK